MRITDYMVSSGLVNQMQNLSSNRDNLQQQVATGIAVSQPSDNPAVYGQVVQLQAQVQQASQYGNNINQALQQSSTAMNALQSMQSLFDQASQIATSASNATNTAQQQANYATQLNQIINQAIQVGNTQFQGNYIFAGSSVKTAPFAEDAANLTTSPATNFAFPKQYAYLKNVTPHQIQIPVAANTNLTVSTPTSYSSGFAGFINTMINLSNSLTKNDTAGIATQSSNLTGSSSTIESNITNAVADNGAMQARLQSLQTENTANVTQYNLLIGNDTNTDIAATMVQLNQAQLAYQAAIQSAASIMKSSILNYLSFN